MNTVIAFFVIIIAVYSVITMCFVIDIKNILKRMEEKK